MKEIKSIMNSGYNNANGCEVDIFKKDLTDPCISFNIDGCCQNIINRMKENRWFKIYVNKDKVDETLALCKVSLEEYLNECTSLGFPAIHSVEIVQRLKYWHDQDSDLVDKYVFTIDNSPYTKHSYYVFCWIRHLYYKQDIVVNYFHYLKEYNLTTNKEKYNLLGTLASFLGGYSIFLKGQSILNKNCVSYLKRFEANNSSSDLYEPFKGNLNYIYLSNNLFYSSWEEVEEFVLNSLKEVSKVRKVSYYSSIYDYMFDNGKYSETPEGSLYSKPFKVFYHKKGYTFYFKTPVMLPQTQVSPVKVLSRHPSHNVFRKNESLVFPKTVLMRLGSITAVDESKYEVKINSVPAIQRSSNKLLMKQCFDAGKVPTAKWTPNIEEAKTFDFPIVAKNIFGSRGKGNYKIENVEQLTKWSKNRNLENYIYEAFVNTTKEYRLHVSTEGVFLAWRKLRRNDTPENQRWFFNNQNCNWIGEANPLFDKPKNWDDICHAARIALNSVGLTIGALDIRVQSNTLKNPKFFVIEVNSAPSMAPLTSDAYTKEVQKLVSKTS